MSQARPSSNGCLSTDAIIKGSISIREKSQIRGEGGGGRGPVVLNYFVFFGNHFCTKTSKNAMKHMILSFKMKGDVIFDHFMIYGTKKIPGYNQF